MKRAVLDKVLKARADAFPLALATELKTGLQHALSPDGTSAGDLAVSDLIESAAADALRDNRPMTVDGPNGPIFVQPFNPALRMYIVGAVHIAQALAPMAALAGYVVTVIDPRGSFATPERFPGIALSTDWPDEAIGRAPPDSRTAVITLTHDPKLDDPALIAALRSQAFYIGALGSRKTHALREDRLRAEGFDEGALARIHGPIGLALGGRSPAEIAIATLAQATQVLHQSDPRARSAT
ncbi:MAG TPA: XdhC family protein [Alphaproteobacteria bacterium]|nr:XdhC family protein [Alphaproteobacteria bacterium]